MHKRLLLYTYIVSLLTFAKPALAVEALELAVSRVGDIEMSCGDLSQEALLMRDIVTTTQDIKENTELKSHGIKAAGAVGSFLVGTATGGVGIAAAGFLLTQVNEGKTDQVVGVQEIAQQRRALMMGIYNAKGCFGPVDHVLQDGLERPEDQVIQIASIEPAAGDGGYGPSEAGKPNYND